MSNIHVPQWHLVDFNVLMFQFHGSFNVGIEIGGRRVRSLKPISLTCLFAGINYCS